MLEIFCILGLFIVQLFAFAFIMICLLGDAEKRAYDKIESLRRMIREIIERGEDD